MTSALTTRTEIAALATMPVLSASLSSIVDRLTDPANGYSHHVTVSGRDAVEAKARLQQADHMCRPAPEALIIAWCRKLVPHLGKAPASAAEFDRVMDGVVLACGDLPYSVWTQQTVAGALRELKWWPAPSEIRALLLPAAGPIWRMRNGLAAAVAAADGSAPAHEPEVRTDEAKARVSAITAAFVAERSWKDPNHVEHKPIATPAHLSDGQLLQAYERMSAEGLPGASVRVAMLRKRLGCDDRMAAD